MGVPCGVGAVIVYNVHEVRWHFEKYAWHRHKFTCGYCGDDTVSESLSGALDWLGKHECPLDRRPSINMPCACKHPLWDVEQDTLERCILCGRYNRANVLSIMRVLHALDVAA